MAAIDDARPTMRTPVRPLLKWVGGKRQLLPWLRRFYPSSFRTYIEPFFGSGAVFFDLDAGGRLSGHRAVLVDSNADLIGCYQMVREHPEEVTDALHRLALAHHRDGAAHYYAVRDGRFNPLRNGRRRADGSIPYTPELAAMLIYLNRTGYNGLFRVNSAGRFNVPAGRYVRPSIEDRDRLHAVASALSRETVHLERGSFMTALEVADRGDFLYIDPPYAPLSSTASFTSYTASGFNQADQERLQAMVIALARRGCHVLMSNSTAAAIAGLYDGNSEAEDAGLRAWRIPARRAVNSVASRRGTVDEYLISNMRPHGG